jgi:membrane fusion protein, heavy metal efflux system
MGLAGSTCAARRLCALPALMMLVALSLLGPASAHEGHDHGAPPTPVTTTIAPRVDASSPVFELIAVLRDDKLTIFVDRFITNEPVAGAMVEVDTPEGMVKATPNPDGTYSLAAPWAKQGGAFDLIFTVTAGADIDVLTGVLKPPAEATTLQAATRTSWFVADAFASGLRERIQQRDLTLLLVALAAFLAGLMVARRRKPTGAATLIAVAVLAAHPSSEARADSAPVAPAAASGVDLAQRFPDGAVFVPKATQRILAVRTIMAKPEEHRRAIALAGRGLGSA